MTEFDTKSKGFSIRKGDLAVVCAFLLFLVAFFAMKALLPNAENGYAEITVNGQPYETVLLSDTRAFTIQTAENKYNTVEIKDGTIRVTDASCPDGLCIRQGSIHRKGESIVCLPNGVVITVKEGKNNSVDFING